MSWAPLHTSPEQAAVLAAVLDRARATGPGHVAVFDLDGCLFDTRQRQVHILREYGARQDVLPLFRVHVDHFVDWHLPSTLRRAGVPAEVISTHKEPLLRFWWDRFFASDYQLYDEAMPGAVQLVRAVHEAGLFCVYLTGRHHDLRPGTEQSFRRFGFPYDIERTRLITKPHIDDDDTQYKRDALAEIHTLGEPVLFLDNEPSNVNAFADDCPDALVVHLKTDHSPRPVRPYAHLPSLFGFLS